MKKQTNEQHEQTNGRRMWAAVAIVGLFLAVCTADNSAGEVWARLAGMAMFAAGAYFGGWMNERTNNEQPNEQQNN